MAKSKRTSTDDLLRRRQQLQNLINANGGGGILGGGPNIQLQADLKRTNEMLEKRGGRASLGMVMQDEEARIAKNQTFLDAMKSTGKTAAGPGGPLSAGSTSFSGVADTAGQGLKAVGERVGGTPGETMKVVGAILQVAGKLDEWAKANMDSTFERFSTTSASMNWMSQQQSRREAGLESHLANQLAPSQQALADSYYNRSVATQPYEEAWQKAKNKGSEIINDFVQGGAIGGSYLGNIWETGSLQGGWQKTMEENLERKMAAHNEESVDLVEWACDDAWISSYARPGDLR